MEDIVGAVGLKEIETDHVAVGLVIDTGTRCLGLGQQITAAGDNVELSGAELVHTGAGFQHLAELDAIVDRATEQWILAIRHQRNRLLGGARDHSIGACCQRFGAELVEGRFRNFAVGMIGL